MANLAPVAARRSFWTRAEPKEHPHHHRLNLNRDGAVAARNVHPEISGAVYVKACHANPKEITPIVNVNRSSIHPAFSVTLERNIELCNITDESLHGLVPRLLATICKGWLTVCSLSRSLHLLFHVLYRNKEEPHDPTGTS